MQRYAFEEVERSNAPVSMSTLCWRLAEQMDQVDVETTVAPGIRRGRVRPIFYKSFRRAVSGLVKSERLMLMRRKLTTVDDALTFYPDKTLRLEARDLRARLLPLVLAYGEKRSRIAPASDIEEELLDTERLAEWASEWEALRPELSEAYARATEPPARDTLLRLLVKGTRYFDPTSAMGLASTQRVELVELASLAELLHAAERQIPTRIFVRLERLYEDAIPQERQQQRELKDLLFRVANFRYKTTPELDDRTKTYLLEKVPEIVAALPGHRPALPRPRRGFLALEQPSGPVFSHLLNEVLNRHVFDTFDFVSPIKK